MDTRGPYLINCGINEENRRLDRIIRNNYPAIPLSLILKSIRTGTINVNGRKKSLDYRLRKGDVVSVPPSIIPQGHAVLSGKAQPLKKSAVIMENTHLLFVNKEAGVLVHGKESLLLHVLAYLDHSPGKAASFTPGPLHRLDRNSSGIICFGKTAPGARFFSSLLKEGSIAKFYLALVDGTVKDHERWEDYVVRNRQSKKSHIAEGDEGKQAVLAIQPLFAAGGKSLLLVRLYTGLTHQIRVQCASRGYPLAGDLKYGGTFLKEGYLLHAYALRFESVGEFINSRCIRALPNPATQKRIELLCGKNSAPALFRKIDAIIEG